MKYSIVIIFITIQLFNGIRSDETSKVHTCDLVRCANVENCPIGTYLQLGNRDKGECCNNCKPFAKVDETCNETTLCSPNLTCDADSQKCKLNCALIQCSQPKCDVGYKIVYDLNTSCCPFCAKA